MKRTTTIAIAALALAVNVAIGSIAYRQADTIAAAALDALDVAVVETGWPVKTSFLAASHDRGAWQGPHGFNGLMMNGQNLNGLSAETPGDTAIIDLQSLAAAPLAK